MAGRDRCRFHPEQEALIWCEKYEYGYCRSCAEQSACTDPDLYCKFRTQCLLWYAHGKIRKHQRERDAPKVGRG
jgi:hypothetical protein